MAKKKTPIPDSWEVLRSKAFKAKKASGSRRPILMRGKDDVYGNTYVYGKEELPEFPPFGGGWHTGPSDRIVDTDGRSWAHTSDGVALASEDGLSWSPAKAEGDEEVRVTDAKTGGQKGQKLAQLGAIDAGALIELARVAGYGGKKYARYNYLKGFDWSLLIDALYRHLLAFQNGEINDPESGLNHAAHAAWHCLALVSFSERNLGTDDRYTGGTP